jgi:catechol 2,3-dioxygenase-like lactoylglutathione lyase family enzyme
MLERSKTHIHLWVRDTGRAATFYEALLGGPVRIEAPQAVLDIESPPLVLTLEERPPATSDPARFVLFVDDPRQVGHIAIALRRAGVRIRLEDEGIEALDFDGNTWRVRLTRASTGPAVVAT